MRESRFFMIALSAAALASAVSAPASSGGALDTVFANAGQANRVCLGNGIGGFSCTDLESDSDFSKGVALGNVDGDSFLDIVIGNLSGRNRVCFGDGLGGFSCSDVSADTNKSIGLAMGFVDDDQHLDLVFGKSNQRNRVCLGDGLGSFTCSDISTNVDNTLGAAIGELNTVIFAGLRIPSRAALRSRGSPCQRGKPVELSIRRFS